VDREGKGALDCFRCHWLTTLTCGGVRRVVVHLGMALSVDMLPESQLPLPYNATFPGGTGDAWRPDFTALHSVEPRPEMLPAAFPETQMVFGAMYRNGEPLGWSDVCAAEPQQVLAMGTRLLTAGMGTELDEVVYGAVLFPRQGGTCCRDIRLDCKSIQTAAVTGLGLDCTVQLQQLAGPAGVTFLNARIGQSKSRLASQLLRGSGNGGLRGLGADPSATPDEQLQQVLVTITNYVQVSVQVMTALGMPELAQATLGNVCPSQCPPTAVHYTPCQIAHTLIGNIDTPLTAIVQLLTRLGMLQQSFDSILDCETTPSQLVTVLQPLIAAVRQCSSSSICSFSLSTALSTSGSDMATPPSLLQLLLELNSTATVLDANGEQDASLAQICPETCGKCNATSSLGAENSRGRVAAQPPSMLTIMYNSSFTHAAPVFLALGDSALKSAGSGGSISVRTAPLPWTYWQKNDSIISVVIEVVQSLVVCLFVLIAFSFIPGSIVDFSVREREHNKNAKHQQYVSGASIPAYWLSNYLYDFLMYLVPCCTALMLVHHFSVDPMVKRQGFACTAVLFLGYGLAICPFTYLMGNLFATHVKAQIYTILFNLMTGIIMMITSYILANFEKTHDLNETLMWVYRLCPCFCLGHGLFQLFINNNEVVSEATAQFGGQRPSLFSWEVTGKDVSYLYASAAVYFLAVLFYDYLRCYPALAQWLRSHLPGASAAPAAAVEAEADQHDEDVTAEAERVQSGEADGEAVQLSRLRKVYAGGKVAVKTLSLGIPIGECFGLLGINGAGKTSALKVLTGDILPTSGTASVCGMNVLGHQRAVRQLIGYCPQFDALLDLLTVREHLNLFCRIKNVEESALRATVDASLARMDLLRYANKLAGSLSGGNKRKLCVAIAIVGQPQVVFLDEPSTGVDPKVRHRDACSHVLRVRIMAATDHGCGRSCFSSWNVLCSDTCAVSTVQARRFMWDIIADICTRRRETTVILTTHNMEECEALCTRVGIMVGGTMRCLGSVTHLRARYGRGYQLEIKLADPEPAATFALMREHCINADAALTLQEAVALCSQLGNPSIAGAISPQGSGNALHQSLANGLCSGRFFVDWFLSQASAAMTLEFIASTFLGQKVLERHEQVIRFNLPADGHALGAIFGTIEGARSKLGIAEYTVSQTTLEQVFNSFAAQQEEETGHVVGLHF
jgi:ABC-type multidrug transport system ATPase subunit